MKSKTVALCLVAICASSVSFAGVQKESLNLDGGSGVIEFHATGHPSAIKIVGKGSAPRGKFKIDGSKVSGMARFDLASLDTGIQLRDRHMKEKYLEVQKFPEAELTILQMTLPQGLDEKAAFDRVPFTGKLTLHGQEHPVSGFARVERKGSDVSIDAQFGLKIADYGIAQPKFAGIEMADDVQISVQSTAPLVGLNR